MVGLILMETTKDQKIDILESTDSSDDFVYVFSRRIKDKNLSKKELNRKVDKEKLATIINKLMKQGKERDMDELELEENCHEWVLNIFANFSKNQEELSKLVKYLLSNFTSYMKTRRREDDRYAVSIVSKDYILLANTVFGEETITPAYEIIPRMMDKDNVMLYVLFSIDKHEKIKVRYYELYPSPFFMDWLGLPQKDSHFYQGGKYRVYTDILGNTTVLELKDEDVEELRNHVVDNQIRLDKAIEIINIEQIRCGKVRYGNFLTFFQDFMAERYDLKYYTNKFIELGSNLDTQISLYRDCNDGVEKFEDDGYKVVIRKHNPHFNILFGTNNGNANIEFHIDYINELSAKYSNGTSFKIFHAGDKFSSEPIRIQDMEIYNNLSDDVSKLLISYLNDTNFRDRNLFYMISFATFKLLAYENEEKYLCYFLNGMSSKFINMLKNKRITDNEDQILEFKGSEYFRGNDDEIVEKLTSDFKKKLGGSELKVYLVGVVEPPKGKLDPIPQQQLDSGRIKNIENMIRKKSCVVDVSISSIEVDLSNCIVVITVLGEKISNNGLFNQMS